MFVLILTLRLSGLGAGLLPPEHKGQDGVNEMDDPGGESHDVYPGEGGIGGEPDDSVVEVVELREHLGHQQRGGGEIEAAAQKVQQDLLEQELMLFCSEFCFIDDLQIVRVLFCSMWLWRLCSRGVSRMLTSAPPRCNSGKFDNLFPVSRSI